MQMPADILRWSFLLYCLPCLCSHWPGAHHIDVVGLHAAPAILWLCLPSVVTAQTHHHRHVVFMWVQRGSSGLHAYVVSLLPSPVSAN